jgi:hypothetical protein
VCLAAVTFESVDATRGGAIGIAIALMCGVIACCSTWRGVCCGEGWAFAWRLYPAVRTCQDGPCEAYPVRYIYVAIRCRSILWASGGTPASSRSVLFFDMQHGPVGFVSVAVESMDATRGGAVGSLGVLTSRVPSV